MNSKDNMSVTFRLVGAFRKAYGSNEASVKIKGKEKIEAIIKKVARRSPSLARLLIDPELESPLPNAVILVNGRDIGLLNGLETELAGGDEVVLIPVIHGG